MRFPHWSLQKIGPEGQVVPCCERYDFRIVLYLHLWHLYSAGLIHAQLVISIYFQIVAGVGLPENQVEHFDILHLDEDEWSHVQIMDQLKKHDVEFILADMWDNIAFIIGCNANAYQIASALHIPERVVYDDFEHSLIIINLFELRYIRGELE